LAKKIEVSQNLL